MLQACKANIAHPKKKKVFQPGHNWNSPVDMLWYLLSQMLGIIYHVYFEITGFLEYLNISFYIIVNN